jgi:predicted Zn finger-like uncharacterized protein
MTLLAQVGLHDLPASLHTGWLILSGIVATVVILQVAAWLTLRHIPNNYVGVVEKLWSRHGSVPEGSIIALQGEAGFQADLLRGGIHFGLWRWQYRIHKVPLVTISQGKIGYIYARDGEPLHPSQTIGRIVACNDFQDAAAFLAGTETGRGQRGRQRAILREGVYAINPALFVVITEDGVYTLPQQSDRDLNAMVGWQRELARIDGFSPVVVGAPLRTFGPEDENSRAGRGRRSGEEAYGRVTIECPQCQTRFKIEPSDDASENRTVKCPNCAKVIKIVGAAVPEAPAPLDAEGQLGVDTIAIVTVHDGPSLAPGEIIAPAWQ